MATGKFELFKGQDGKVYWHLRAANNEIIASSQGYANKANAEKGIASVKSTAAGATIIDNT